MGKLGEVARIDNTESWTEARPLLSRFFEQIRDIVNGNIELDSNIRGQVIEITFAAANTQQPIKHGLGRTPTGYILIKAGAATSIYDGTSSNTSEFIYLRSSAATTVKVLVF
jgi:hypothetical protein